MGRAVVVTGATSFLGRYLLKELCRQGVQVYAIARPQSAAYKDLVNQAGVTVVPGDMTAPEQWLPQIPAADAFMHLGWEGPGPVGRADTAVQQSNVKAAGRCLDAAAALGCRTFLFAGSQAEYGPQTGMTDEQTPCAPVLEYGRAKLQVYQNLAPRAAQLGVCWYQARIYSVYGPGDHPWALVPSCVRTFCAGEQMALSSCRQNWNFMYAPDTAAALCALLFSGAPAGIYNVAGPDTRPLLEFVQDIHRACGGTGSYTLGTYISGEAIVSLQPDITRLRQAIGTVPYSEFLTNVTRMAQTYRQTGKL